LATPSRHLAFRILTQIGPASPILSDLLADASVDGLPPRDRAFLHELVLGTLRRRGALDTALSPLLERPFSDLHLHIQTALRIGAYQILRLRVPDRAAVSESVDLVRSTAPRAAGLVNAVLRRLAREGPPPERDPQTDPLGWLTTTGSLPRWIAERWIDRLGAPRAVSRARAFLEPPPTAFRPNPHRSEAWGRVEAAGLDPQPLTVPGAWKARRGARATDLAAERLIYLQDEGSQLVAHVAAHHGLTLDACAAPGGKALLMADQIGLDGTVVAADASPRRLRTLAALLRRWGAPNVRCIGADTLRSPFRILFDAVLVDAPCSGLGTLARHPDIRWRLEPDEIARHAARQRSLLTAAAALVVSGGPLVYSTCSLEHEENEGVVEAFLAAHPDFHPEPFPDWAAPFSDGAYARTLPERDGGDGFFLAPLGRD